jgi:ABC-2 type transport system ATP-binding protein
MDCLRWYDDRSATEADHGDMINVEELSKRYGPQTVLDRLSFTVRPGIVTGFLGPNGAGKSTTMRVILGLDAPTSGRTAVNGRPVRAHATPLTEIGALLDAKAVHPMRSARNHLRALAATAGISDRRVDEVITLVGLDDAADRLAGNFSLGMGQRLGIASALLGDPKTLMLDEPVNGLDPEGIVWIRHLLKDLAADGRTVFVSSHLMSEMALIAEHFVIIGRGRLIADVTAAELQEKTTESSVRVRTPEPVRLRGLLAADGATVTGDGSEVLDVAGTTAEAIGGAAARAGIALYELTPHRATLEEIFMELTHDAVEYESGGTFRRAA